jgi:cytochrome b6-f complex iron-sulfur subunit
MDRRDFIVTGCKTGLGLCLFSLMGESCGSAAYYAQTTVGNEKITVAKKEFQYLQKNEVRAERSYVFVKPTGAEFPICLYKKGTDYSACLMKCTHRGCEVEVHGTRYVCPCHGSEFDMGGMVLEGPAERPLKTFKTTEDETNIYIWLV